MLVHCKVAFSILAFSNSLPVEEKYCGVKFPVPRETQLQELTVASNVRSIYHMPNERASLDSHQLYVIPVLV